MQKMKMHATLIAGLILFGIECLLLLFWFFFGIVVCINDRSNELTGQRYVQIHLTAVLHFTATITICLVLEAYRVFETVVAQHVIANTANTIFAVPPTRISGGVGYLMSWGVSLILALGTDYCILIDLIINCESGNVIWLCEFVIAVWCMIDSILALFWSGWIAMDNLHKLLKPPKKSPASLS